MVPSSVSSSPILSNFLHLFLQAKASVFMGQGLKAGKGVQVRDLLSQ
jgi:hypothetical protein